MNHVLDYFYEVALSIPLGAALFVALILLVIAVGILLYMVFRLHMRVRDFMYPAYDQIVKKAEYEADHILTEAREQARAIRTRAELEASKVLADHRDESKALHAEFVKEFESVANAGKEMLGKENEAIQSFSKDASARFKQRADEAESALKEETETLRRVMSEARATLEETLRELAERADKDRSALVEQGDAHIKEALEEELKKAREAIAAYQKERYALVDREIVHLVEEVAHTVLNRSLSLDEHTEIIKQALAEAKQAGVFSS